MRSTLSLKVGHATDQRLKSGVTVVIPDRPAKAAVHIAGGAPSTRETELLSPEHTVCDVNAIVLSGGSAFGLAAADGVMAWLAERQRGFQFQDICVPIVPTAILFDLANGGDKSAIPGINDGKDGNGRPTPYPALGYKACETAADTFELGSVGAGTGATTANLKGGLGAANIHTQSGMELTAIAAVNPNGKVTIGEGPHFRASLYERDEEFGGLGAPDPLPRNEVDSVRTGPSLSTTNTIVAVVATNVALGPAHLKRLAMSAQDGIALSVFPAHTPIDGDTVFSLSTAELDLGNDEIGPLMEVCRHAPVVLARAISLAVYQARPFEDDELPCWTEKFG